MVKRSADRILGEKRRVPGDGDDGGGVAGRGHSSAYSSRG